MFRELTRAKGVELTFEQDRRPARARSSGDAGKVRQVVINLLSNAVKFTERGRSSFGPRPGRSRQVRHRVVISVEDTGPGIAPENLDRIFEAFDQAESAGATGGRGWG